MKRRDFLRAIPPAMMLPMLPPPAMSHPADAGRPWHATLRGLVEAARSSGNALRNFLLREGKDPASVIDAIPLAVTFRTAILPMRVPIHRIGKLNHDWFCGAGPGELLFSGFDTDRETDESGSGRLAVTYRFDLKIGHRWDEYLDPSGRWVPLRAVYDTADFGEIP